VQAMFGIALEPEPVILGSEANAERFGRS